MRSFIVVITLVVSTSLSIAQDNVDFKKVTVGYYNAQENVLEQYTLFTSGEVIFTNRLDKQTEEYGKMSKSDAKKIFEVLATGKYEEFYSNKPGKDYCFMELNPPGERIDMLWGKDNGPADIEKMYQLVFDGIKLIKNHHDSSMAKK